MTAYQVYEQSVKALSVSEKLTLVRLVMDEVAPQSQPQASTPARPPRQFGAGRHLLEGVDINDLLATPIEDMFADYMPEDH